jgi:hypothetical protein
MKRNEKVGLLHTSGTSGAGGAGGIGGGAHRSICRPGQQLIHPFLLPSFFPPSPATSSCFRSSSVAARQGALGARSPDNGGGAVMHGVASSRHASALSRARLIFFRSLYTLLASLISTSPRVLSQMREERRKEKEKRKKKGILRWREMERESHFFMPQTSWQARVRVAHVSPHLATPSSWCTSARFLPSCVTSSFRSHSPPGCRKSQIDSAI